MTSASEVITPFHRRFIVVETIIGTVMSGLVPAALIGWLKPPGPVPLFGSGSLFTGLIGATLLPAFGMPIILTQVIRLRVRKGGAPALAWPIVDAPVVNRLPRALMLRGLLGATVAALLLPAPGITALAMLGVTALSKGQFVLYNFLHGAAIGLLLSPFVVTAALADGDRFRSPTVRGT